MKIQEQEQEQQEQQEKQGRSKRLMNNQDKMQQLNCGKDMENEK